ncbi:S49 family peptidase [Emticicia sp. W12TSBA100-4]|uniref:S49 family peptidase n=1 Tax=Emticicia sp. W12TSBA100-4 TaxID=3160965 RepID=UPI003305E1ED
MIANLITKSWALEPTYHDRIAALVLAGKVDFAVHTQGRKTPYFEEIADTKAVGIHAEITAESSGYKYVVGKARAKSGFVAIIPIIGTMSRYGDYCSWGTEDIGTWILEANADENVSAIVLEINSGGGEVDGTAMLATIVKQSKKPIVAYVAGMAASAAYWVASQCREIVMESKTSSEVGSIGVLATHIDASGFYEKEGYKITIIRSKGSESKALFNSVEPLTEQILAETQATMEPIRNEFEAVVRAGRPDISDTVFEGKMYNGKEALKLKMADRIGFLGDAIDRADFYARQAA